VRGNFPIKNGEEIGFLFARFNRLPGAAKEFSNLRHGEVCRRGEGKGPPITQIEETGYHTKEGALSRGSLNLEGCQTLWVRGSWRREKKKGMKKPYLQSERPIAKD